jgi:antitoxin PrlF
MDEATLTSKSQLTLPKAVRDALNLGPGDKVRFVPSLNGYRLVATKADITQLRGFIKSPHTKPVTIKQMNEGIAEAVAKRNQRALRSGSR